MSLVAGTVTVTLVSGNIVETFAPSSGANLARELYEGPPPSYGAGRKAAMNLPNPNMPKGCQLTATVDPGATSLDVGNAAVMGWVAFGANGAYAVGDRLGSLNYIGAVVLNGVISRGSRPPPVTATGTFTTAAVVEIDILNAGDNTSASYAYKLGGVLQSTGILSPSLTLNGITFTFPDGSYSNDNVYVAGQYESVTFDLIIAGGTASTLVLETPVPANFPIPGLPTNPTIAVGAQYGFQGNLSSWQSQVNQQLLSILQQLAAACNSDASVIVDHVKNNAAVSGEALVDPFLGGLQTSTTIGTATDPPGGDVNIPVTGTVS